MQLRANCGRIRAGRRVASLAEVVLRRAAALEAMARGVRGSCGCRRARRTVWGARQVQMAHEFVCKGTMLPSEIARHCAARCCGWAASQ